MPKLHLNLLLPLLAVASMSSCSEQGSAKPPNVILICLDTVRADHLGAYGYEARPTTPYLDELADRSTLFLNASATAGWTKPSVPSFLTGTMPCEHGVYEGSAKFEMGAVTDVLPDEALTLAEVFEERGYRTAAFVKNAQLRLGNGFEQGFDVYLDEVGDARDIRWAGLDWIDEVSEGEPFFLYLHFLDAHWPYAIPPDYAARFAPADRVAPFQAKEFRAVRDAIHDGEREFTAREREDMEALYDGALRYLDDQLGLLDRGLRLRGLEDDTIVCVISDHGEEFGEHGRIGHGHGLWENLLRVPWILHVPGRAAERFTTPVSLLDLFPTLVGAVGGSAMPHPLGVDRLSDPSASRYILAEHKAPDRYESSLRRDGLKIIRGARPVSAAVEEPGFPVGVGQRWEAELSVGEGNELVATQLKPRDESPEDPIELKGYVAESGTDAFRIGGIPIALRETTEIQLADGVADERVRDGRAVKVRGELTNGVFVAQRLKLYPLGEKVDFELRGPVLSVQPDGERMRIAVGGFTFVVDERTEFKDIATKKKHRMSREEVVQLLESQGTGFAVSLRAYDLDRDPGETQALDDFDDPGPRKALEELGRRLVEGRTFGEADRVLLTPEAIARLKAIGYAR